MSTLSYRKIFTIAFPVIAANILLPLQGLVDTAIMAHRPDPAFPAALGIAVSAFTFIYISFNFLQYATSGLSAQALGRSDFSTLRALLWHSLFLAALIAICLLVFKTPIIELTQWYYQSSVETASLVAEYISYCLLGAFAALGNLCLIGWFAGQSRTREIFIMQSVLTASNIALSLFLANVLQLDLVGVALGTVFAQYLAFLVGIFFVIRLQKQRHTPFFPPQRTFFTFSALRPLLGLNRDIFIRTFMLMFSLSWFQRLGSAQSDEILAANIILLGLLTIAAFALDGVAVAAEGLTGQAIGSQQREMLAEVVQKTAVTTGIFAILLTALFYCFAPLYVQLMTSNVVILTTIAPYQYWAIFLPLVAAGGYLLDGFYFGATAGSTLRNMMLILTALTLPIASTLAHFFNNHGIWLGIYAFFILRAGLLTWQLPRVLFLTQGKGNT